MLPGPGSHVEAGKSLLENILELAKEQGEKAEQK
jgi:hypothetical protein